MSLGITIGLIITVSVVAATIGAVLALKRAEANRKLKEAVSTLPEEALTRIIEEALVNQKYKGRAMDILTSLQMLKIDMENES